LLVHPRHPLPRITVRLQRQLQEAQDGLRSAADGNSAQHTAVASRLKEAEQEVAASHKEAKAVREQVAALQALVVDRERGLAEQAGALQRLEKHRGQLEAANAKVAKQLAAAQSQAKEAAAAGEQAKRLRAAATRKLEEQLSKEAEARQQAEQDAAAAKDALADEQRRQSLEVRAWERRFRELQQDAAERLQAREAAWATQREAAQRETVAAVEKVRRQQTKRLYLAEGEWALRLQQSSAEWGEHFSGGAG
jgi:chromosome segregation ATPase